MPDATELTEPSSTPAHTTDEPHVLDELGTTHAIEATHDGADSSVAARTSTTTASEPALESPEVAIAHPAHSPDTTSSTHPPASSPGGDLMRGSETLEYGGDQDPDAPSLPPRPADEHPAWSHSQHLDSQSMNRVSATPGARRVEEQTDPAVAQLKGMFPDFDDAVL